MPSDLDQYPMIEKYFGETIVKKSEHPLAKQVELKNKEYLVGIEVILRDLGDIPGFQTIIRDSQNSDEFYDNMSTLRFCRLLEENEYQIKQIFGSKGSRPIPDIKFYKGECVAYGECKHILAENEWKDVLFGGFKDFSSMFDVWVWVAPPVYLYALNKLITDIKRTITEKEKEGAFSEKNEVEIDNIGTYQLHPKESRGTTGVCYYEKYQGIHPEHFRFKIMENMDDASKKFRSGDGKLNYLFIKSDEVKLQSHVAESLLYSNGLYEDREYETVDSVIFVDWKNDLCEYPNPHSKNKVSGRLFCRKPVFPLSSEWLKKLCILSW